MSTALHAQGSEQGSPGFSWSQGSPGLIAGQPGVCSDPEQIVGAQMVGSGLPCVCNRRRRLSASSETRGRARFEMSSILLLP